MTSATLLQPLRRGTMPSNPSHIIGSAVISRPWDTVATRQWITWMLASYQRWLGEPLAADAEALYEAAAVVVSHRLSADPLFVYANRAAQQVWSYPWSTFVGLPSRLSAPTGGRQVRNSLLTQGQDAGYVVARDLIRVDAHGRLFRVDAVTLWNVCDDAEVVVGQAATYAHFTFLDAAPPAH